MVHIFASDSCPKRWTLCLIPTYLYEDVSAGNASVCRSNAMDYSITRWNNPIIFHWHQTTLGDACKTLGKTDSAHCMPKLSLPWNIIRGCVWTWECITECSRWQEHMPKTREEGNRSIKKESAWGLTVVWFNWALYVPQIWRVQPVCYGRQWEVRSKEQVTGGKRRGAEVDGAQTGAKGQGSNKKSDTRTREKDQVSQAGAERLKFQELERKWLEARRENRKWQSERELP